VNRDKIFHSGLRLRVAQAVQADEEGTMRYKYWSLDDCHHASGVVVVIDVVRAFTCAAVVLAGGAQRDYLVGGVEEALALRQRLPNAVVMGEIEGIKVR